MKRHPRQQIMIDQPVQGTLIARVALYWFLSALSTAFFGWCWSVWCPAAEWSSRASVPPGMIPAICGSLIVLPVAIADVIRVSHRFVGPVHSLRNAMKRLALGDDVQSLRLRDGDFWNDLVRQFNQLLPAWENRTQHSSESDGIVNDSRDYSGDGHVVADDDSFVDLPCSLQ